MRCTDLYTIERYSHVMHIVSEVRGRLSEGEDAFSLQAKTFPAGTVSGAPKIRAMEIIEALEPSRRGPYAGTVGYFSLTGDMDTCITIRTMVVKGGTAYLQAGAGIVADSDPRNEWVETCNKMEVLKRAIAMAEEKRARADFVIPTDVSLEETRASVRRILACLNGQGDS